MSSTQTKNPDARCAGEVAQFPDVIYRLKKSLGITDEALASACGIARSTLRTKIRNVDLFTVGELKRIGPALGADYTTWLEPVAA